MSWALKCDRCGKFFEYHTDDVNGITLLQYDVTKNRYQIADEEYELCPDCVKEWEDWFERGKTQK